MLSRIKITKFGLTLIPQIYLGAPKILKPVLDTPFWGILLGKVLTTPPDLKGMGKIFAPPHIFLGEGSPWA